MKMDSGAHRWVTIRNWCIFLAFAGVALYFLLGEHRVHVLAVLPWLLIFCCPLMMLFMHHGDQGGATPSSAGSK